MGMSIGLNLTESLSKLLGISEKLEAQLNMSAKAEERAIESEAKAKDFEAKLNEAQKKIEFLESDNSKLISLESKISELETENKKLNERAVKAETEKQDIEATIGTKVAAEIARIGIPSPINTKKEGDSQFSHLKGTDRVAAAFNSELKQKQR